MHEVRLSVKAIIIRDGRLLVLQCRDKDGIFYLLPGGGQIPGETLEQALRRECLEELGCEVRMGGLRFVRDYIAKHHEFAAHHPDAHQVELMFEAYLETEPSFPTEPDSGQEGFAWLEVNALPGCRLYPRVLEVVLASAPQSTVVYLGDVN
jgi:ADP-ribose pyrophosphatase YjhB (NUDIX family)